MVTILLSIISILLGATLGYFIPDTEALINAFYTEPNHHVSTMLRSYYKERKFKLLRFYWLQNRHEYSNLIIFSAFFQLVFFVFAFYIVTSSASLFASMLVLAVLARLFYEQYKDYKKGQLDKWFWAINVNLTKRFYAVYFSLLFIVYFVLIVMSF